MNTPSPLSLHKYLKLLLVGLLIATAIALLWQRYTLDTMLEVTANPSFEIMAQDDRTVANEQGDSVALLRRDDDKLILECDIGAGYQYPFCELQINLQLPPEGIDFRKYKTVTLRLKVEGPNEPRIRFFIRNYNPEYSTLDNIGSQKVMELSFVASRDMKEYTALLSQFTVASWWSNAYPTALEYAGIELNNITLLSLVTGGDVVPGKYTIVVDRITFTGKKISDAQFRLIIIFVWVVSIFSFLLADTLITRRRLFLSKQRHLSLSKINEALLLESKSFEKMAHHDALTGVLNRQGLRNVLLNAAQLTEPKLFPLSMVFMDIDHFKRLNDTFGHNTGDQVLKELAGLIKPLIKQDDLITRWGGEEFLIMFPGTTAAQAVEVIERIRRAISAYKWPSDIQLTCSFGITEAVKGEDLSATIGRADEAMYNAKRNGRNRVEVSKPEA